MMHTFERELIANQRHQDLLRSFAERQRVEQASPAKRTNGILTTLAARLRGTTTKPQRAAATA